MKLLTITAAILIAFSMAAFAGDHGTITVTNVSIGPIKCLDFYWYCGVTNHADTTTATDGNGEIQRVTFKAIDATNTYSVTIKDRWGVDILQSEGVSITTNAGAGTFTTKIVCPMVNGSSGTTNSVKGTFAGPLYTVATNTHVGASGIVSIQYIGR